MFCQHEFNVSSTLVFRETKNWQSHRLMYQMSMLRGNNYSNHVKAFHNIRKNRLLWGV